MSDRNEPVKGSAAPTLCANGCGFFGNSAFAGMCSQCYKATHPSAASSSPPRDTSAIDRAMAAAAAPAAVSAPAPVAAAAPAAEAADGSGDAPMATADAPAAAAAPLTAEAAETPKKKKKKKKSGRKRCHGCRKKVGLTGFVCRCGEVFCDTHRYADAHSCTFDYAADHRSLLAKNNPRVVASKLDRL